MTPTQPLLSTAEVAELANVSPASIRRWVDDGRLAAITLPTGILRFRREDVEALLTPAVRAAADAPSEAAS